MSLMQYLHTQYFSFISFFTLCVIIFLHYNYRSLVEVRGKVGRGGGDGNVRKQCIVLYVEH